MNIENFQDHYLLVREIARNLCRGELDPEDLAQDAIERWLRARSRLLPGSNHAAWLTRVVKNLYLDRQRRRRTRAEVDIDCGLLPAVEGDPSAWWRELDAVDIDRELARLPSCLRQTFRLFAFEGKSYAEIACQQGIAPSTVGTRIRRARLRIRQLLEARVAHPRATPDQGLGRPPPLPAT